MYKFENPPPKYLPPSLLMDKFLKISIGMLRGKKCFSLIYEWQNLSQTRTHFGTERFGRIGREKRKCGHRTILYHMDMIRAPNEVAKPIQKSKKAPGKVTHKLNTWGCWRVSWFANLANELFTRRWKSPGTVTHQLTREINANLPANPLTLLRAGGGA